MKHAASRELYAYWQELRGRRPAPERAEIEPGAIRQILSEAFILALDHTAGYPFRLAGTRVCALFGRELKGESFVRLWDETSRRTIRDLLGILADEWVGTVAGVTAHNTSGELVELELLLLAAERQPAESATHHRRAGAAEDTAMDRAESGRRYDARQPPSCRRCGGKTAAAAIFDAAQPARFRRLRRRALIAALRAPLQAGMAGVCLHAG